MTEQKKEINIQFAPGCFDNFEGTQEELQEMIAMIRQMVNDGTLEEHSTPVDPEDEEFIKFLEQKTRPRQ
jgi:hypothetical protein